MNVFSLTLTNIMIYLAAAYGVIWLAVFALIFSMNRRQAQLNAQIDVLEEIVERQSK